MPNVPKFKLNTGAMMPAVGRSLLSTYNVLPDEIAGS